MINLNNTEEDMLRQRAKINWIILGDSNHVYLYDILRAKYNRSSIYYLKDKYGNHI